ncbi:NAD(P)-binding protein [Aspergillus sclerotioniger CBS 115572]|uniref:NAD(P)-binding protein n=1 Tax=Aspergillus sclerotioniger CBS 115572 TaxID=1450535 RepID=A0A317X7X8_9EURO|nr:NAD(P)-binding protein [Aspergillus sclerotioniger CBS 115572]PWY94395.1 NAD(P)-binding protein [Aspergillus sclerotioniger CBS 115572]
MARQWVLTGQEGFETSLEYQPDISKPSAHDLGPNEVLVRIYAASLNYRDLKIASPANFNGAIVPPLVPACDGAGMVGAVGSSVKEFSPGDRVVTHLAPKKVESHGDNAPLGLPDSRPALGQGLHGTLRSHGVFSEYALVHAPTSLEWLPAATLTCTWTTAWNALFGLKGKEAGPGSWVLVQGTGGVSIATLQLAVAAGATVVATTSNDEKAARLKALGATHVVSYRTSPAWGDEARQLTPDGRGFDFVIDIGGNQTLSQSLAAVRVDGIVLVVGMVGEDTAPVPLYTALLHTCIVRGLLAGSRNQFREVVRFIDEKGIVPEVDEVVFELAEAKSAYRRLQEKKHFAKVVIRID